MARVPGLPASHTLIVRRLDRIAGSETMAIQTISELHAAGVNIKSLTEPDIDTTTPMGRALTGFNRSLQHRLVGLIVGTR